MRHSVNRFPFLIFKKKNLCLVKLSLQNSLRKEDLSQGQVIATLNAGYQNGPWMSSTLSWAGPESLNLWFISKEIGHIFLEAGLPLMSHLASLKTSGTHSKYITVLGGMANRILFPQNVRQIEAQQTLDTASSRDCTPTYLFLDTGLQRRLGKAIWVGRVSQTSLSFSQNLCTPCRGEKEHILTANISDGSEIICLFSDK